jgi:hypothetical protein
MKIVLMGAGVVEVINIFNLLKIKYLLYVGVNFS